MSVSRKARSNRLYFLREGRIVLNKQKGQRVLTFCPVADNDLATMPPEGTMTVPYSTRVLPHFNANKVRG